MANQRRAGSPVEPTLTTRRRLLLVGETRWLSQPEQAMWRAFFDMRRHLERAISAQLAEHGLSHPEYTVLVVLSEAPEPMRSGALGDRIGWETSRLTHQLRRMESRGLLTRHACPQDRRGTLVGITDRGREAIEAAAPGHVHAVRSAFIDLLSPDEIDVLTEVSLRVSAEAERPRR